MKSSETDELFQKLRDAGYGSPLTEDEINFLSERMEALERALRGTSHKRPSDWEDDDPCWCRVHLPDHDPACLAARAALGDNDMQDPSKRFPEDVPR